MTSSPSSSPPLRWTPTRRAALDRLQEFLPRAGRSYATERNTDFGPGRRDNVSNLSPYLRRHLITEEEVITAVLDRHTTAAAGFFRFRKRIPDDLERIRTLRTTDALTD